MARQNLDSVCFSRHLCFVNSAARMPPCPCLLFAHAARCVKLCVPFLYLLLQGWQLLIHSCQESFEAVMRGQQLPQQPPTQGHQIRGRDSHQGSTRSLATALTAAAQGLSIQLHSTEIVAELVANTVPGAALTQHVQGHLCVPCPYTHPLAQTQAAPNHSDHIGTAISHTFCDVQLSVH